MPALSYHFGLGPEEVWRMTVRQYAAYTRALDSIEREMRRNSG